MTYISVTADTLATALGNSRALADAHADDRPLADATG